MSHFLAFLGGVLFVTLLLLLDEARSWYGRDARATGLRCNCRDMCYPDDPEWFERCPVHSQKESMS